MLTAHAPAGYIAARLLIRLKPPHLPVWQWSLIGNTAAAILLLTAVNGCVHICLDSIVGDIYWLLPWHDSAYSLFTVTARFRPWWLNFILHWTFLLELGLWLWAGILYNRTRRL